LARSLGFPSRRALYSAMTAAELIEWEVMYGLDPWGEERADLRNGLLCSLTDACHRSKGTARSPIEYMPYVQNLREEKVPEPQVIENMKALWAEAVEAFNGE
jgi:hypothetical protein